LHDEEQLIRIFKRKREAKVRGRGCGVYEEEMEEMVGGQGLFAVLGEINKN
jgi:hypothetical protein